MDEIKRTMLTTVDGLPIRLRFTREVMERIARLPRHPPRHRRHFGGSEAAGRKPRSTNRPPGS